MTSRSFGDSFAHKLGVLSKPDVTFHEIRSDTRYIILGSDGLFDFMKAKDIIKILKDYPDMKTACKKLYNVSSKRWMKEAQSIDDISIIIIQIDF